MRDSDEAGMVVGVGFVDLLIPESRSLKEKRKVVRSVVDRLRARFNAAVAEVGDQELWGRARIGFSVVANDTRFVNSSLDQIRDAIDHMAIAIVADSQIEILHL